jgi:secreted Zn-dependent insulinase-like peptidase
MEGLYTTYDNYNSTNRNNIENIIKSFNETGNNNIAELIKKIIEIYKLNETKIINNETFEQEKLCNRLEKELKEIIEEKKFWNVVIDYIKKIKGIK